MKMAGLSILLGIPLEIFRGFVLTILWGWFVVPQFGVKPLPVIYAVGIMGILAWLLDRGYDPDAGKDWKVKYTYSVILTLVVLGFGWFWSLFR